jgi:hypothetical protein
MKPAVSLRIVICQACGFTYSYTPRRLWTIAACPKCRVVPTDLLRARHNWLMILFFSGMLIFTLPLILPPLLWPELAWWHGFWPIGLIVGGCGACLTIIAALFAFAGRRGNPSLQTLPDDAPYGNAPGRPATNLPASIVVTCIECGARHALDLRFQGQKIRCRRCSVMFDTAAQIADPMPGDELSSFDARRS